MLKPAIIAALVAALLGGGYWYRDHVYDSGYAAGEAAQKDIGRQALDAANTSARERERVLQAKADEANTKRNQEKTEHEEDLASVRAAARAGAERLSIKTAARACPAGANTPASTSTGPGPAETADLVPGTADDVFRIAGGITQIVRDYNALLERYHAACQ